MKANIDLSKRSLVYSVLMNNFDVDESHNELAVGVLFTTISISKTIQSEIKKSNVIILIRLSLTSQQYKKKK